MTTDAVSSSAMLGLRTTTWALLLPLVLLTIIRGVQKLLPKPLHGIPYNNDAGIFGDIKGLRKAQKDGSMRPWFWNMTKKHNSAITQVFFPPLSKPSILLADYHESYDIMVRRTNEFGRAKMNSDAFMPVLPNHHVCMDSSDPRFKTNKELVKGLMTPTFLSDCFAPVIYEKVMQLVRLWEVKMSVSDGRHFAALQDVQEEVIDATLALIFGVHNERNVTERHMDFLLTEEAASACAGSRDVVQFARPPLTPDVNALVMMTKCLHVAARTLIPRLQCWILKKTAWRKHFQIKEMVLTDEIRKATKRLSNMGNDESNGTTVIDHILLREIAAARKSGRQPSFNEPIIRDELLGFFVAGSDTVGSTMGWTIKFLGDNQAAQAKLRRQLRVSYGDAYIQQRRPTVAEIIHNGAPYLDAFVEESFRCARTVPINLRQAVADTELLGHQIPKGTNIMMMLWGASLTEPAVPIVDDLRTPASLAHYKRVPNWVDDDVTQFKPERWLKAKDDTTIDTGSGEFDNVEFDCNAGPMLIFGAGPRGCFGKRLAYLDMRILLVLLVWNFTFEQCAQELSSYDEHDDFTTMPTYCYVKLRRSD